jgi:hypothetical protein
MAHIWPFVIANRTEHADFDPHKTSHSIKEVFDLVNKEIDKSGDWSLQRRSYNLFANACY